jgi:hypothetical protein
MVVAWLKVLYVVLCVEHEEHFLVGANEIELFGECFE